jgi:chromosome segregation ATPase
MRPADITPEQIIEAGQALLAAGRNVTGFALRQRLSGGNANRLKQIWEEYAASQAVTRAEPVAELPVEVADALKAEVEALVGRVTNLVVDLNDRAVKAAERRVAELVRTTGEQREQMERELADASTAVDEMESQLEVAKGLHLEVNGKLAEANEARQTQAVELAQVRERAAAAEKALQAAHQQREKDAKEAAAREVELREQLQQVRKDEQLARDREAVAAGHLQAAQQQREQDAKVAAAREAELREQLQQARKDDQAAREREATANGQLMAAAKQHDDDVRVLAELRRELDDARLEVYEESTTAAELRGELKAVQQELARVQAGKAKHKPAE